jgi:hypothetical protein
MSVSTLGRNLPEWLRCLEGLAKVQKNQTPTPHIPPARCRTKSLTKFRWRRSTRHIPLVPIARLGTCWEKMPSCNYHSAIGGLDPWHFSPSRKLEAHFGENHLWSRPASMAWPHGYMSSISLRTRLPQGLNTAGLIAQRCGLSPTAAVTTGSHPNDHYSGTIQSPSREPQHRE